MGEEIIPRMEELSAVDGLRPNPGGPFSGINNTNLGLLIVTTATAGSLLFQLLHPLCGPNKYWQN